MSTDVHQQHKNSLSLSVSPTTELKQTNWGPQAGQIFKLMVAMFCMAVQHQEFSSSASSRGFSELCEILHPDDLHDAYKHTYAYIYTLSLTASAAALFRIHNTVGSAQAEPIHLHVHWMSKHWPSLPETVDYQ